jgi:lipopolysaccharide transport system ATP-binding protein
VCVKTTLIELNNVGVYYNAKPSLAQFKKPHKLWILRDLSLKIFKGEVLGIIGKNGAGKSTLLSLLAGIIAPNTGTMVSHAAKSALLSLQVGFVGYLTGRQNIYLSGMLLGIPKKVLQEKIQDIIEFSELNSFIDCSVDTYSSGMKARLGFSISICLNPDVILIDEVLSVGDRSFKRKSKNYLREKISNQSTTAVIVSHDESIIEELCDRAVFLNNGTIALEGKVQDVYLSYKNEQRAKVT